MNENQRRKLLQGIAVSTPALWIKPVISVAVIPAHAIVTQGNCAEIAFNATVGNPITDEFDLELDFETFNVPENTVFELELSTEHPEGLFLSADLEGQIEDGSGTGYSFDESGIIDGSAAGKELTVRIDFDDAQFQDCTATTTIIDLGD